ncbi:MAG: hypothetical protein QG554_329 [Pseudomonadota bacterium]|nr:hypothetical protein [Pseudomonadota bacterium]
MQGTAVTVNLDVVLSAIWIALFRCYAEPH